jgi:hypothetical protein
VSKNFGGSGPLLNAEVNDMPMRQVHLTAAEIKGAGPILKELVPAPGAGKTLVLMAICARLNFLTAAFVNGSDLDINIGPAGNSNKYASMVLAATINDAETSVSVKAAAVAEVEDALANMENQALNLCLSGAVFITGGGSLDIDVFYQIATL